MGIKTRTKRVSQRAFVGLDHFTRRTGALLPRDACFIFGYELRTPTASARMADHIIMYFAHEKALYATIALHVAGQPWQITTTPQTIAQATQGGTDFIRLAGPDAFGWLLHEIKLATLKGWIEEDAATTTKSIENGTSAEQHSTNSPTTTEGQRLQTEPLG